MSHFIFRGIRTAIYLVPWLIIGYAIFILVDLSGARVLDVRPSEQSALVSQWFPAQRLDGATSDGQLIRSQPVYVTVRYPRRYDDVRVSLTLDNPNDLAWRVGLERAGTGDFSYDIQTPDVNGSAQFSLKDARINDRSIRFMLTLPDAYDKTVRIRSVRIEFLGKPHLLLW